MNKSTKSATKNVIEKTTVEKTKVRKASPTREAYQTLCTELKTLTATKKAKKTEILQKIDALWAEYKMYTKSEYKPARAAAIKKFETIKAESKMKKTEKKAAAPKKTEKKAAKKPAKKPVEKVEVVQPEVAETK